MKWMPKWLGNAYSKLWAEFGDNFFYREDVEQILGKKLALTYLSEIKRCQALFIFTRKNKKRVYRLVPPNLFMQANARGIDFKWLRQGAYTVLLLLICVKLEKKIWS